MKNKKDLHNEDSMEGMGFEPFTAGHGIMYKS